MVKKRSVRAGKAHGVNRGHHTAHGDAAPNAQPFKSMCAGAVTHVAVVSSVMRMSKASFTAAASCSENLG